MEFTGKNVAVRTIKPTDFEQALRWSQGSEESFFLLNFPLLFNRDDLARETAQDGPETCLIVRKSDEKPLGLMKVGPVKLPEKQTQLRFTINTYSDYSADHALEAPTLMLDHLFREQGMHKVQAYTLEFEKEYEHLLQKLGFHKEGAYQHHFFHKERYYAVNIFGLFKTDFIR